MTDEAIPETAEDEAVEDTTEADEVVDAAPEASVQVETNAPFVDRVVRIGSPPSDELSPRKPPVVHRAVVDETVLGILSDLKVVVDGVPEDDLWLRSVRSEDQILHRATDSL